MYYIRDNIYDTCAFGFKAFRFFTKFRGRPNTRTTCTDYTRVVSSAIDENYFCNDRGVVPSLTRFRISYNIIRVDRVKRYPVIGQFMLSTS